MTLVPRGYLTMSGDITDFHNGGREEGASGILCVEGRSAAKRPAMFSTAPHQRMIRARVSVLPRWRHPGIEPCEPVGD